MRRADRNRLSEARQLSSMDITLRLRPVVRYVAVTDYCNRNRRGEYINPHLYRVPVTLAEMERMQ